MPLLLILPLELSAEPLLPLLCRYPLDLVAVAAIPSAPTRPYTPPGANLQPSSGYIASFTLQWGGLRPIY